MAMRGFSLGFMVGFGTGFMAREIFPVMKELGTPIARITSKSGVKVFEYTREAIARIGENLEDIVAEVRAEMRHKRSGLRKGKALRRKPGRKMAEVVPLRKEAAPV